MWWLFLEVGRQWATGIRQIKPSAGNCECGKWNHKRLLRPGHMLHSLCQQVFRNFAVIISMYQQHKSNKPIVKNSSSQNKHHKKLSILPSLPLLLESCCRAGACFLYLSWILTLLVWCIFVSCLLSTPQHFLNYIYPSDLKSQRKK